MDRGRIHHGFDAAARAAGPRAVWLRMRQVLPVAAQCAGAAGVAWWLASALLGHTRPVFAAIAAIICLAGGTGERARQAVDLVSGVVAGVVVGELVRFAWPGSGAIQVVAVVVLGMLTAAAIDYRRLAYIQGAASALFVLVLPPLQDPGSRIIDALIGGLLGLLGSQVLFTPDPVALVADSLRRVLDGVEESLLAGARSLEAHDDQMVTAIEIARDARSELAELSTQRVLAHRIRKRTVRGRRRAARLRQLDETLDHVDVLVAATILLTQEDAVKKPGGPAAGEWARFLRDAGQDVATAGHVLGERSRGHYVEAGFTARVPTGVPPDAASYARAILRALEAMAPGGHRDGR